MGWDGLIASTREDVREREDEYCGFVLPQRFLLRSPGGAPSRGHTIATAMSATDAAIAPICARSRRAGIRLIAVNDSTP